MAKLHYFMLNGTMVRLTYSEILELFRNAIKNTEQNMEERKKTITYILNISEIIKKISMTPEYHECILFAYENADLLILDYLKRGYNSVEDKFYDNEAFVNSLWSTYEIFLKICCSETLGDRLIETIEDIYGLKPPDHVIPEDIFTTVCEFGSFPAAMWFLKTFPEIDLSLCQNTNIREMLQSIRDENPDL